jgi:tricorn protease
MVEFPRFSPDGRSIAFTGNYDGNRDIYTVPAEGGVPHRVTHHPGVDTLCGWTPDGRLLFMTNGLSFLQRAVQLFTVSPRGGLPQRLPVPYGTNGTISPDGRWLAYTPHSTDNRTWKRYAGGMATDIWLFDLKEMKSRRVTDWKGTDTAPMWFKETLFYASDQGPEHRLNIWRFDPKSGARTQITRFADYDVKWPSVGPGGAGEGEIVFQKGSALMSLNLTTNAVREVVVSIPGDRPAVRPRTLNAANYIRYWAISPNAKRVVVSARGDIWTLPAREGAPRNYTRTNGVNEIDPAWSPDGKWIAYFSDHSDNYELHLMQADGKGTPRKITSLGAGYRSGTTWSPDSKWISYTDNAGRLIVTNVENEQTRVLDTDPQGNPVRAAWSGDSRWLTYSRTVDGTMRTAVWIVNASTGERHRLTSGKFNEGSPVFDRKGEFLYFTSSRNFSPKYEDLGTTWIYTGTEVLLAMPLRGDVPSPLLLKSDEETVISAKAAASVTNKAEPQAADPLTGTWAGAAVGEGLPGGAGSLPITIDLKLSGTQITGTVRIAIASGPVSGAFNPATGEVTFSGNIAGQQASFELKLAGTSLSGTASALGRKFPISLTRQGGTPPAQPQAAPTSTSPQSAAAKEWKIDVEGAEGRSYVLNAAPGNFAQLGVNNAGHLVYVRTSRNGEAPTGVYVIDPAARTPREQLIALGGGFEMTPDGSRLLIPSGSGATIHAAAAGSPGEPVPTGDMQVTVDPRVEWRQMLRDTWRIQRDYFYDPNMHGVDWAGVFNMYARMLEDAATREDLTYISSEMISELNVGHAYYQGGENTPQPAVGVGMLGCDYVLDRGAYRIAKIYRGAPWDTDAVGPLSIPGVKVNEGDYLLAVNGVPLDTEKDPWAAFQGKAGSIVTLTISSRPQMDDAAREVTVRTLASEVNLRYRYWIEQNRLAVEKASGGRIGYIYVPDTGIPGQNDLFRQFTSQMDKDALLIDERWNGGGQIPTRFIELLNRPVTNQWARRHGADWVWPIDGHRGPKAMLVNGLAGSGGDAFPWYFQQAKLGKVLGTRTWGGLVGISGYPPLLDGAETKVPGFAFYKTDGNWGIEGHGVEPDITVMDDPAQMQNGADPQLAAGIAHLLEELKRNPFIPAKRPPYPNRRGFGADPRDK